MYTMRLDGTDLVEVPGAGGSDWGTHPLGE